MSEGVKRLSEPEALDNSSFKRNAIGEKETEQRASSNSEEIGAHNWQSEPANQNAHQSQICGNRDQASRDIKLRQPPERLSS